MIFEIGGIAFFFSIPRRVHAGWFVIAFGAVIAFAIVVMLVVATSCGDHTVTDPGSATTTPPLMAGQCAPFCSAPTTVGWPLAS
ncbi:hypothetical protein [Nocardia sp. NPDC004722]